MRYLVDLFGTRQTYVIRGGSDQLPNAFVAKLGDRIRYGAAVAQYAHSPQGVSVTYPRGSAHDGGWRLPRLHDPFGVLRNLELVPPFSAPKMRAIADLPNVGDARLSAVPHAVLVRGAIPDSLVPICPS